MSLQRVPSTFHRSARSSWLRRKNHRERTRRLAFDHLENRRPLAIVTVTSVTDLDDADADAISALMADNGPDGVLSLREAIRAANGTAGHDTIQFGIPGCVLHTIRVGQLTPYDDGNPTGSALPVITDPITIDGYSQCGSSINSDSFATNAVLTIELDGAIANGRGLDIRTNLTNSASGSIIRGLVINGFNNEGIILRGVNNVEISGNFIGTDATGTIDFANRFGVVLDSASNNLIGGLSPGQRNVISGNQQRGVYVDQHSPVISANNLIAGNLIGTDKTGAVSITNAIGVQDSGTNNIVGGLTPAHRNIISMHAFGLAMSMAVGFPCLSR